MFSIIQAAGWPIWFLLAASVIAVALIIERFIVLRRQRIAPSGLLEKVVDAYRKQAFAHFDWFDLRHAEAAP